MTEDIPQKINILLAAFEHTQTSYRFLGERAQTLYSWIGSVLLAVVGVIAALGPGKIAAFGTYLRLGITIAILTLFVFSWLTEIVSFRARVEEGKSAIRIVRLLHLFEAGYFDEDTIVFDEREWTEWMNSPIRKLGISPGTSVIFVLAVVATIAVWAS
jgi:hypothetical protein